jgi:hypothetical protein
MHVRDEKCIDVFDRNREEEYLNDVKCAEVE